MRRFIVLATMLILAGMGCAGDDKIKTTATTSTGQTTQTISAVTTGTTATTRGATSQAGALPDPCTWITQSEVEAAIAAKVLAPKSSVELPGRAVACAFNSPQFPTLQVVKITLLTGSEAEMKDTRARSQRR
jgi:hypothetical protein